jgi:hypothetical protein
MWLAVTAVALGQTGDPCEQLESSVPTGVFLITVNTTGDRRSVLTRPETAYIPPNHSIIVIHEHDASDKDVVLLDGVPAFTNTKIDGTKQTLLSSQPKPAEVTVDCHPFGPRAPGSVTLSVTDASSTTVIGQFVVPQPISGAVRIGVGVGTVVDASFRAVIVPGSSTPEIVSTSGGEYSTEVIVGFAPFLDRGGRLYEAKRVGRLAPYLGIGALGAGVDDLTQVTVLQSVYVGGEVEFMRQSSLAVTAQLKRIQRLAAPFVVGGPYIGPEPIPTVSSLQLGAAVVFNVAPDFLQVNKRTKTGSTP